MLAFVKLVNKITIGYQILVTYYEEHAYKKRLV
jgi:hypothetical protein